MTNRINLLNALLTNKTIMAGSNILKELIPVNLQFKHPPIAADLFKKKLKNIQYNNIGQTI